MRSKNSAIRSFAAVGVIAVAGMFPAVAGAASLVEPGSEVQLLHGGFSFTEGPVSDGEGNIYFSDIPENLIYRWSLDGELTVARENSGGANGLLFDADENLLACEGIVQRVTSMDAEGNITVLAERYDGKRLNSPNDLWMDTKGGIYFTDPRYRYGEYPVEQDGEHVYYVSPDRASITRVVDSLKKPNGIMASLDGKLLYVADTAGKVYVFDVQDDASLENKRIFANQASDGMAMDERGNLYLTWFKKVSVYAPDGEKLEDIPVPESPANVTFGGAEGKTLFITARTGFYSVCMTVKGRPQLNRP